MGAYYAERGHSMTPLTTDALRIIARRAIRRVPGDAREQHAQSRRDVLRLIEEVVRLWAEREREMEVERKGAVIERLH